MHFISLISLASAVQALVARTPQDAGIAKAGSLVQDAKGGPKKTFPTPSKDDFYKIRDGQDGKAAGTVLDQRRIISYETMATYETHQLLYRTNNALSKAIATVVTVWKPITPASPPKIFSFQQAEDSLNIDCAPSYGVATNMSSMAAYYHSSNWVIEWALKQGWYVAMPDHEGPESAWLVGLTAGQATLDGIRATINHFKLGNNTESALFGYSGGAHASAWAASLQATYAPGLKITSAAFGGTPIDLRACYDTLNKGNLSILAGTGLAGVARGYPAVDTAMRNILTAKGKEVHDKLLQPDQCSFANNVELQHRERDWGKLFTKSQFEEPTINNTLNENSLLAKVNGKPVNATTTALFLWHGTKDATTPFVPEESYVRQQCDKNAGSDIRFVRLPDLPHIAAFLRGMTAALGHIQAGFKGELKKEGECGRNMTIPDFGSKDALAIVPGETDRILKEQFESYLSKGL